MCIEMQRNYLQNENSPGTMKEKRRKVRINEWYLHQKSGPASKESEIMK